ncbi:MAG: BrnT family toxin [Nitrospirota bacterium]
MYTFPVRFEWDEEKRTTNLAKHGIDFLDVPEIFTGPMLVGPDVRNDYGESMKIGFGFIRGRLMAVVCTERAGTIRIISARKANTLEEARDKETVEDELGNN